MNVNCLRLLPFQVWTSLLWLCPLAAEQVPLAISVGKEAPEAGVETNSGESAAGPVENSAKAAPERLSVEKIAAQVRPSLVTVINAGREGYAQGLGTGFVLSADGLVATNLHVVGEARPIEVELQDGSRPKVTEILAWSREHDLIIFRMERKDLPALRLAEPGEELAQGTAVVAMGNPLGLRYSVVEGVVSELRKVDGQELIQMAMPIEKGNSGGPLVDSAGMVRGIINMKSAVTENLGYAIPVDRLHEMLKKPSPVKMENWLTIGALNPRFWKATEARWTQRAGRIRAVGQGDGFGGRSVCVYQPEPPPLPYEVSVRTKLGDESGAAGLAFCSDGADVHYGFYPTAGKLRLTRFEGPDVSNWTILEEVASPHYKPDDWNLLRVRVEKDSIKCYLNGHEVITSKDSYLRTGRAGLCKFRHTEPEFKDFRLGATVTDPAENEHSVALRQAVAKLGRGEAKPDDAVAALLRDPGVSRDLLDAESKRLDELSRTLRTLSQDVHRQSVIKELLTLLSAEKEPDLDLGKAALLVSKFDNPDLDPASYLAELDRISAEIKAVLTDEEKQDGLKRMERLISWLFKENGYHGSRDDYESKPNSYLNEVIDDREGIPISLSVLVMELGRRLDIPVAGVPIPGHFMVQYRSQDLPEGGPYFDVFDGGKQMDQAGLALHLGFAGRLPEESFVPASKKQIIIRMVRNLIGPQLDAKASEALPYLNLVLALSPEEASERFSRAIVLYQKGDRRQAKVDIQWLLDRAPAGLDLERLQEWLDRIEAEEGR